MKLVLVATMALSVYAGTKIPFPQGMDKNYSLIQRDYSSQITRFKRLRLAECIVLSRQYKNSRCVKDYTSDQNKK